LNRIALIVPVKGSNPKARLSAILEPRERKQLQLAMLEDTLQAIARAGKSDQTFVVTSNPEIVKFAGRFGVGGIEEASDAGVNEAVEGAISKLPGYDGWLILPADLPLITAADIKNVFTLHRMGSPVIVSPSADYSGTNLLLMTKRRRIALHYDDDSFNKHVREATATGARAAVYYSENVSFDIDQAGDVHRYFSFGRRNSTMNFLERTLRQSRRVRKSALERRRPAEDPDF
jgi:2-phospho-L-lactate/phosphoenolpyruvate guanylyltransferase